MRARDLRQLRQAKQQAREEAFDLGPREDDDLVWFVDDTSAIAAAQAKLDAEIASAGGLDAWRALPADDESEGE